MTAHRYGYAHDPATQWMLMWQQMARMWMSYMMPFAPGAGVYGSPTRGYGVTGEIEVELDTAQRAKVKLRLTERGCSGELTATLSHESTNDVMRVTMSQTSLSVKVPEGQKPGKYRGVLLDSAKHEVGTVTIEVFEPKKA